MSPKNNPPIDKTTSTAPVPPDSSGPMGDQKSSHKPNFRSKTMGKVIIAAAAIVVAGLAVALITHYKNPQKKPTASTMPPALVTIASGGITPATLVVKVGTQVTWTNTDTKPHQIAADPYPLNNSIPGFNSTVILLAKDTFSFTFEKAGNYTYHDQRNPLNKAFQATVIVK